jgi:hypothetical protein
MRSGSAPVALANSPSMTAASSRIGSRPFLKLLLKKMSAKLGARMTRMPKSVSAQGACSREEPQPKFSRVSRISAWAIARIVQHELGLRGRWVQSMSGSP